MKFDMLLSGIQYFILKKKKILVINTESSHIASDGNVVCLGLLYLSKWTYKRN